MAAWDRLVPQPVRGLWGRRTRESGFLCPGPLPFPEPSAPCGPGARPEVLPVVEVPGGGVAHPPRARRSASPAWTLPRTRGAWAGAPGK